MSWIRRISVSLTLAALAAAGIRIGGGHATESQRGGWRPIRLPDQP